MNEKAKQARDAKSTIEIHAPTGRQSIPLTIDWTMRHQTVLHQALEAAGYQATRPIEADAIAAFAPRIRAVKS